MALETKTSVFAKHIQTMIETAAGLINPPEPPEPPELHVNAVFYGDQNRIPLDRTVCVEPSIATRVLNGIPRKTLLVIEILVIVYLTKLQSPQMNREESDELIEEVQDLLHSDPTLGGKCIHSLVTRVESGYASKENGVMRAARLSFEITTQELLPQ